MISRSPAPSARPSCEPPGHLTPIDRPQGESPCPARRKKLERVAYHEAGHAVAQVYLHRSFRSVSIKPKSSYLGRVDSPKLSQTFREGLAHYLDGDHRTRNMVDDHILISMAGPAAENRYTGRRGWDGARQDLRQSRDLGEPLYGEEATKHDIPFMTARADSLMKSRIVWVRVEAVAAALLERCVLTSAEVREIGQDAYRDGFPMPKISAEAFAKKAWRSPVGAPTW
jgi:hypothetical protein